MTPFKKIVKLRRQNFTANDSNRVVHSGNYYSGAWDWDSTGIIIDDIGGTLDSEGTVP